MWSLKPEYLLLKSILSKSTSSGFVGYFATQYKKSTLPFELMCVGNGAVGIFTSSVDGVALTVNGEINADKLILGTVDNTDNAYISASDGNVKISGDAGGSGDVSLTIQNSDTSTSTSQTMTIAFAHTTQNAGKIVSGKDNVFVFGSAQNDSNMQFHTTLDGTDTERMRITSAGLIGIGNSSPTKTLTVNGDISASGDLSLKDTGAFLSASIASNVSASFHMSSSLTNVRIENLPTNSPNITGSLWLSGSAGAKSKYLVVFTGEGE